MLENFEKDLEIVEGISMVDKERRSSGESAGRQR